MIGAKKLTAVFSNGNCSRSNLVGNFWAAIDIVITHVEGGHAKAWGVVRPAVSPTSQASVGRNVDLGNNRRTEDKVRSMLEKFYLLSQWPSNTLTQPHNHVIIILPVLSA